MRVHMSGTTANLVGNWSLAGVTQNNLDSLSTALCLINPSQAGKLQIDCRQVDTIDATGRQILNVWMNCVRLRGVEPELVIPSNNLRHIFKNMGLRYRYMSRNAARQNNPAVKYSRRRSRHEYRADKGNCQET